MHVKQNGRLLCAHELVELIADSMNDAILVKIVAQRSRCDNGVLTLFSRFPQPCRSLGTLVVVGCSDACSFCECLVI